MDTSRNVSLALIAVVLSGGCSLALSGPQKDRRRGETPRCDTGKGMVVADGLVATGLGIGGLGALSNDAKELGGIALALGAVFAFAALKGDSNASECRAAFDQYAMEGSPRAPDDREPPTVIAPVVSSGATTPPISAPSMMTELPRQPVVRSVPQPEPVTPAKVVRIEQPSPPEPAPVVERPPAKPPARPKPPAKPEPAGWDDFWQEVP